MPTMGRHHCFLKDLIKLQTLSCCTGDNLDNSLQIRVSCSVVKISHSGTSIKNPLISRTSVRLNYNVFNQICQLIYHNILKLELQIINKYTKERDVRKIKNPNGFGSVIPLFGKTKKKTYAVRVTAGWLDGKQQYRYISYHEKKIDAVKALANEQINPTQPKENITLEELFTEWKTTPKYRDISKQTQDNYNASHNHLKPLCKTKFNDLRAKDFQAIIDRLDRSKSTKSKIKILAGLLYKYAMELDICNKNYADFIKIAKEEKKTKDIFTDIEIKKLFKNDSIKYVDTILILIYTGLRINEMLNLTKFNIDLKNQTITGGLKTDAGKDRTVPIHPKIRKYIESWYNKSTDKLFFKGNNEELKSRHYREYIYLLSNFRAVKHRKKKHHIKQDILVLLYWQKLEQIQTQSNKFWDILIMLLLPIPIYRC